MRACGVHTYADYQALLDRSPAEYERLARRAHHQRHPVLPERGDLEPAAAGPDSARSARPVSGEIRVWSAGCSSGEEAYTLAILAAEHLERAGRSGELDRLVVDATDVDRLSLERAEAARYRRENLTEMPPELVDRYFEPAGPELQVVARVRERVFVRRLDLSSARPPRRDYHLIVCRNVLIYFDRPMQERLFQTFTDAWLPGGYLVLGKVETLFGAVRDRLLLVDPRERVYRRPA